MRNATAREIRKVLNLPSRPKDMTREDRAYYRFIKRKYDRLPGGNARRVFLEAVPYIRQQAELYAQAAKMAGAQERGGV